MTTKISLKKGLALLGFNTIKVSKGTYNYRSGFMDKDGQTYYFSTRDLRSDLPCSDNFLLIRTARDRKDYKGGINTYNGVRELREMGYELHCPRKRQDFNSN
jgi:hypothetical protein